MRRRPPVGHSVMASTAAAGATHGRAAVGVGGQHESEYEASGRGQSAHHGSSEKGMKRNHLAAAGAGGLRATTSLKSGSGEPPTIRSVLSTTKWS